MKIAVIGLTDFPLGKRNLIDARLKSLEPIIKPSKTTFISLEFLDSGGLKEAEAIICEKEAKLDLLINDLETVENRLGRVEEAQDSQVLARVKDILEKNKCLCEENFTVDEKKLLFNSNFVSIKPIYFVDKNENKSPDEIIFGSYYDFGMLCFITGTKDKELKSWPIKKGTTALEAAGVVHSDIQRGFIKAEIIAYVDLVKAGNLNQAKQSMHLEGKDYIIQDADIVNFRFNV